MGKIAIVEYRCACTVEGSSTTTIIIYTDSLDSAIHGGHMACRTHAIQLVSEVLHARCCMRGAACEVLHARCWFWATQQSARAINSRGDTARG